MRGSADLRKEHYDRRERAPPPPGSSFDTSAPDSVPPPRSRNGTLLVGGLLGAVVCGSIAILIAVRLAEPDVAAAATPSASPAVTRPESVSGLAVERAGRWTANPDSWKLSVTWTPVEGATEYLVSRDGTQIGRTEESSFVDGEAEPESRPAYAVVAVDAEGDRSTPTRVRYRSRPLPDRFARVQGRWLLTLRVESSSIGAGGGQIVLTLSPTCPVGPCSTEWTFQGVGNTGTADRRGSSYRGTGSGGFLTLDCSGATVTSTVTVEFRVRQAHTVGERGGRRRSPGRSPNRSRASRTACPPGTCGPSRFGPG